MRAKSTIQPRPPHRDAGNAAMASLVDRWQATGVIDENQARRMRADLPAGDHGDRLLSEAMGYLGGVLIALAAGLGTGWYWTELGTAGRLALIGGAVVVLLGSGFIVTPEAGGPAGRLRAVLWSSGCAALYGWLFLLGWDVFDWRGSASATLAAAGAVTCAAALWARHHHPALHLTTFVGLSALTCALVALLPEAGMRPGLALWATGLVWALFAWGGTVRPAAMGRFLGAAAAVAGSAVVAGESWGVGPALATVIALVVAAVWLRDLWLLGVASVGVLLVGPPVLDRWHAGTLGVALTLFAVGLVLVGAAVVTARRRSAAPAAPGHTTGPRWVAGVMAGAVVAVGAALLLIFR